jgi:transcriptional regulator GlxA family with amidase domain
MHRIVVLALDGVVPLNLATPFSIFGDARDADGRPLYSLTLAGARAGPVATSAGFPITVARGLRALAAADTIVVPATSTFREPADPAVLRALRRTNARVMSICAGAFVLAEAGLLDGRRATTHWAYADAFRSRFPAVALDPAVLYVDEGDVLTSAGAAAGIDLCLYVVAADHGAEVANRVARHNLTAPHRDGGQAQFVERPLAATRDGSLEATRAWALDRLGSRLTIDELAKHAAMSRRTLIRRFKAETGTTPLQWLIIQRTGLARRLLEETDLPIEAVAARSGFGSAPSLREHFRRSLATSPQAYRATFRRASDASASSASPRPRPP